MRSSGSSVPLNGRLEIELDEAIDPLSVTRLSVTVTDAEGKPLAARRRCARGRLVVELEVGPELLAAPPEAVEVRLAGGPSVHALSTVSGRRLDRPAQVRFPLRPVMAAQGGDAPRLVAVDGLPLPLDGSLPVSDVLVLRFDGPVDPATVTPEACPLLPVSDGLLLSPVHPRTSWRCLGQRFEVELGLPPATGPLLLDLQRFGLRGLDGERPVPNLQVRLSPT